MILFRFWLARHLIHAGLAIMPEGRCRAELTVLLRGWGDQVRAAVTGSPS